MSWIWFENSISYTRTTRMHNCSLLWSLCSSLGLRLGLAESSATATTTMPPTKAQANVRWTRCNRLDCLLRTCRYPLIWDSHRTAIIHLYNADSYHYDMTVKRLFETIHWKWGNIWLWLKVEYILYNKTIKRNLLSTSVCSQDSIFFALSFLCTLQIWDQDCHIKHGYSVWICGIIKKHRSSSCR